MSTLLKAASADVGAAVSDHARQADAGTESVPRLVTPDADGDERAIEAALRPRTLAEFIGQERLREQVSLMLEAARARGRVADHVLLCGPPGLGKTTMAMIIAAEMGGSAADHQRAGRTARRRPGRHLVLGQRG